MHAIYMVPVLVLAVITGNPTLFPCYCFVTNLTWVLWCSWARVCLNVRCVCNQYKAEVHECMGFSAKLPTIGYSMLAYRRLHFYTISDKLGRFCILLDIFRIFYVKSIFKMKGKGGDCSCKY